MKSILKKRSVIKVSSGIVIKALGGRRIIEIKQFLFAFST
jgi:hypothetical protein